LKGSWKPFFLDYSGNAVCLVYLDDIITFGSTFKETLENLSSIFDRLQSANLKLKPKKCAFFQEHVSFLGHIVSHDGIRCSPEKVAAVQDWPTPTSEALLD
jgi:hypothetical protein